MTTWDTAEALRNLLPKDFGRRPESYGKQCVKKLAIEIGKTIDFIYDHLNLLKESEPIKNQPVEWLVFQDKVIAIDLKTYNFL